MAEKKDSKGRFTKGHDPFTKEQRSEYGKRGAKAQAKKREDERLKAAGKVTQDVYDVLKAAGYDNPDKAPANAKIEAEIFANKDKNWATAASRLFGAIREEPKPELVLPTWGIVLNGNLHNMPEGFCRKFLELALESQYVTEIDTKLTSQATQEPAKDTRKKTDETTKEHVTRHKAPRQPQAGDIHIHEDGSVVKIPDGKENPFADMGRNLDKRKG